jgi:hypothetical protein
MCVKMSIFAQIDTTNPKITFTLMFRSLILTGAFILSVMFAASAQTQSKSTSKSKTTTTQHKKSNKPKVRTPYVPAEKVAAPVSERKQQKAHKDNTKSRAPQPLQVPEPQIPVTNEVVE